MTNELLLGYEFVQVFYQSDRVTVYRAIRQSDQLPVVVKLLPANASLGAIARLKHEYKILTELEIPGVIKAYDLECHQNRWALILEDIEGISLRDYINSHKLDLVTFLRIALQPVEALGQLHQSSIIHRDIKPDNLIINPHTLQVKIIDFGLASRLSEENQALVNPNSLEGTLVYMSPEQTGRMNRAIGHHTDLYSLGVTFYEILTGQVPFLSNDRPQLLFFILAHAPQPPHEINSGLPLPLSQLLLKLMAKNAEERYQSAEGLKVDLERCLVELQARGKIANFTPGQLDLSSRLTIPQKLYGREAEVQSLLAAFERASQGKSELMLISGYSGIGKSSLVNEVHKPITQRQGHFIAGKFDQFQRNIPYAAFIQAFSELIRQLLTESDERLANWKRQLLKALGANGQIIIDVIPEMEWIIGPQPTVPQLGPTESQNRFNLVFQSFIRVFAQSQHPLVVFLDDLQWADSASLKLIQLLMSDPGNQHLLLIGAYRDNEVTPAHPLMHTLEEIRKAKAKVNQITLQPLDAAQTQQLVIDTLHQNTRQLQDLSDLLFNRTAGNPFFLTQLLKALYQHRLLKFNYPMIRWQWDLQQIQTFGLVDQSVVELLIANICQLPTATQKALQLAACIGNQFNLQVLATISEQSLSKMAEDLWPALEQGLILPGSKDYKIPLLFSPEELEKLNFDRSQFTYRFLHDRVQQAAYALIPEDEKKPTHLRMGRLLLENANETNLEENLFDIVNHLNTGVDLLTIEEERIELAELNLRAGQKAKLSTAYEAGVIFFKSAIEILTESGYQTEYQLTLEAYLGYAECSHLCGQTELAEEIYTIALVNTKNKLDQAKVYSLLMTLYASLNRVIDVIKIGREALSLFDVMLPQSSEEVSTSLNMELSEVQANLGNRRIEDLINSTEMIDPAHKATMSLLNNLVSACYFNNKSLFAFVVLKMVNLSLKFGLSSLSAFAYITFGLISHALFGDHVTARQYASLALKVADKFNDAQQKCRTNFIFGSFISHWMEPLKNADTFLLRAYQNGLEAGDIIYSTYALNNIVVRLDERGIFLDEVNKTAQKYLDFLNKQKDPATRLLHASLYQSNLELQGLELNQRVPHEDIRHEQIEVLIQNLDETSNVQLHLVQSLRAKYILANYEQALEYALSSVNIDTDLAGQFKVAEHCFYYSLTLTVLHTTASAQVQQEYWEILTSNQQKMQKWAENCPENFLHKYLLVAAEMARISGKKLEAIAFYDQAIATAQENEFLHHVAIANELAAKFYLEIGKEEKAKLYMTHACEGYLQWGAIAKVKLLQEKYPFLVLSSPIQLPSATATLTSQPSQSRSHSSSVHTSTTSSARIDIESLIKASQTFANEIVLGSMLHKLMEIVLENAAAEKGYLLLYQDEQLLIEAFGQTKQEVAVLQSQPIEQSQDLPISAINYVVRTKQVLNLSNAIEDKAFNTDPYIARQQVKSLLCIPIMYQGELNGVLYLENNITKGAFAPRRLEILRVLSSQAAISIRNANLYNELQQIQNQFQEAKMSALGQLVSGIAHEINNPISFIYGNLGFADNHTRHILDVLELYNRHATSPLHPEIQARLAQIEDWDYILEDLPRILTSMKFGAERIRAIVLQLRTFSRLDEAEIKEVDLHENIRSALTLLDNRLQPTLKRPAIEVIEEYSDLPLVECCSGLLNQVFMDILTNAIEALDNGVGGRQLPPPRIWIRTEVMHSVSQGQLTPSHVAIHISDNGVGMTEETMKQMFNPFFTTKPIGKNKGLGLSTSHQIIIEKHQGLLQCQSTLGEGAEFTIQVNVRLPESVKAELLSPHSIAASSQIA